MENFLFKKIKHSSIQIATFREDIIPLFPQEDEIEVEEPGSSNKKRKINTHFFR